nr:unnamed protein product [Spirometra erinaceieuropaei]
MNNGDDGSLSPRDRILLSHKLHLSCKVVNALLFIFAIILLAVGAYKLRLLNTGLEDCSPASGEDCNNKSSSSAGPYTMIIAGCILILHCAMIFGVMIALAREASKYIRQLSNQLPELNVSSALIRVGPLRLKSTKWPGPNRIPALAFQDSEHAKEKN